MTEISIFSDSSTLTVDGDDSSAYYRSVLLILLCDGKAEAG